MRTISIRTILLAIPALSFGFQLNAQRHCAQPDMDLKFKMEHPELAPLIEAEFNKMKDEYRAFELNPSAQRTATVYTIPVVFHIVHNYGPENIADAQIMDAIRIMNEDYSKTASDLANVTSAFSGIIGQMDVEFKLAQLDPNGNCTNGIDRIASLETYVGDDGSKLNGWPRNKYLNIWVVSELSNGAAGYSYLPSTAQWNSAGDGIIVRADVVGSIGIAGPTNKRALTHEAGHWANLMHTWGGTNTPGVASNCTDDDGVTDTPNCIGVGNFSCNVNQNSCDPTDGLVDNVQNIMDYSSCELMFTVGQVNKVRLALQSSTASRNNLWSQANLQATGLAGPPILCKADFTAEYYDVCQGEQLQFNDASYNGVTSWSWSFPNGSPLASSFQDPIVTYYSTGEQTVSLTSGNGTGTVSVTKPSVVNVWSTPGGYMPLTESFESVLVPGNEWKVRNIDGSSTYLWTQAQGVGATGNSCMKMNTFGATSGTDELLSPTYDLSTFTGAATVKFKVSAAMRASGNTDKLTFYVSTNCGQTWSPRWSKSGASLANAGTVTTAFEPNSAGQWTEYSVTLTSSYLSENVRFKFGYDAGGGNNLYLDDINVTGSFNPVPMLIWPFNGEQDLGTDLTIDWKSVGDVDSYEYHVDVQQTFSSPALISGTTAYQGYSPTNTDTEMPLTGLMPGSTYYWRVRTIKGGIASSWSSIWSFTVSANGVGVINAEESALDLAIIPNPVSGSGVVSFALKTPMDASVRIFSASGQLVSEINNLNFSSGIQRVELPSSLSAGVYFCELITPTGRNTKRFIVE